MFDASLTTFLEQGLAIHLGTRNADLEPNGVRVTAVKVSDDRLHLVLYVTRADVAVVLEDLRDNGQAAVTLVRPSDDRACQVKGTFVDVRDADENEQPLIEGQWQGFVQQLEIIGLPALATSAWMMWPCVAIRIKATALFDQTPGPGAGGPLVQSGAEAGA
jgi:hypothetical protein